MKTLRLGPPASAGSSQLRRDLAHGWAQPWRTDARNAREKEVLLEVARGRAVGTAKSHTPWGLSAHRQVTAFYLMEKLDAPDAVTLKRLAIGRRAPPFRHQVNTRLSAFRQEHTN